MAQAIAEDGEAAALIVGEPELPVTELGPKRAVLLEQVRLLMGFWIPASLITNASFRKTRVGST